MQKLQQEQKQNELKKKDEENRRRQQEESERLEAQKKKPSLKPGREEQSWNLQPNRHYPACQTLLLRKQSPWEDYAIINELSNCKWSRQINSSFCKENEFLLFLYGLV